MLFIVQHHCKANIKTKEKPPKKKALV